MTTATAPAAPATTGPPRSNEIDCGVTLGTLDGRTVVVAAFATAGITSQLQLPPNAAATIAVALLACAQEAGLDVTGHLAELLGTAAPAGLIGPSLTDTARIDAGRRR